jgi:ferredoxin
VLAHLKVTIGRPRAVVQVDEVPVDLEEKVRDAERNCPERAIVVA